MTLLRSPRQLHTRPQKTDPTGAYVRKWLPALRGLPPAYIYEPWKAPKDVLRVRLASLAVWREGSWGGGAHLAIRPGHSAPPSPSLHSRRAWSLA